MTKQRVLIVLIIAIIFLAGCSGESTPNDSVHENITNNQTDLESTLTEVEHETQGLESDLSELESRGVDTDNASQELSEVEEQLTQANRSITNAREHLDQENFEDAREHQEIAEQHLSDANNTLSQAKETRDTAYQAAINDAETALENANHEYLVAIHYIDAAAEAGGDVSDLSIIANQSRQDLQVGIDAIEETEPNPKKALQSAGTVTNTSERIQTASSTKAKKGIAEQKIDEQSQRLSSDLAAEQLESATSAADRAQFEEVERYLTFAQQAQQVAIIETYINQVEQSTGISLEPSREITQRSKAKITDEERPDEEISQLRSNINRVSQCLNAINQAERTIAAADQSESWFVDVETETARDDLNSAKTALENGEYDRACESAERAESAAQAELDQVESRQQSNPLLRVTGAVHSIFERIGVIDSPQSVQVSSSIDSPEMITIEEMRITYSPPGPPDFERLDFDNPEIPAVNPPERPNDSPESGEVEFEFDHIDTEKCGFTCPFTRTIVGAVENSGSKTAHNVEVQMEVYLEGTDDRVISERATIGTLEPGEVEVLRQEITASPGNATTILGDGEVDVVITISSDEKTQEWGPETVPID